MLQALRRRHQDDEGFTLIELMVVVLIIAILLAIAIPTFLGARARAQDRAAQSNLRNTLTAEKTFYTDKQSYTNNATATDLSSIEPSITYIGNSMAAPATAGQVAVQTDTANNTTAAITCLTVSSASGKTFTLVDEATGTNPGTYYFPNGAKLVPAACTNAEAILGGAKF